MGYWILILAFILPIPWVAKTMWPREIKYAEIALISFICAIIVGIIVAVGHYTPTSDVEIWSGEVTGKKRVNDSYVRSYECRCRNRTVGSGKNQTTVRECDTCYEDRYTVTWTAYTTLRNYTISSLDETSRSVWLRPDPARYTEIQTGDPVAMEHTYTNYVKAAPESLFHAKAALTQQYAGKLPEYPSRVYDFYKINRALSVGVNVPDLAQWNQGISLIQRKLGPARQANTIVVFVNELNSNYVHALEAAWLGGKKNDIIVVVGTTQYPKIDWVRIISWTDKQLFKVGLRNDLEALGTVDRTQFLSIIEAHAMKTFVRKNMKDFEYLQDEIDPPMWVLALAAIFGMLSALGLSYYFYRNDF